MKTFSEYRERLNSLKIPDFYLDEHGNPKQAALLPYLAGLIDGEGTIRIYKGSPKNWKNRVSFLHSGSMSIGMVERKPVELVTFYFGGSLREDLVPDLRSIWRWAATGNRQVKKILDEICPYLMVKREQAMIVLDLIDNWYTPRNRGDGVPDWELRRREDLYLRVRKLNAVGAAATTERKGVREDEATVWTDGKPSEGTRRGTPPQVQLKLVSFGQ